MATPVRKAVALPREGDFLTDGKRLVEVLGRTREGYEALDASVPLEVGREGRDPRATEILTGAQIVERWRIVSPAEPDAERGALKASRPASAGAEASPREAPPAEHRPEFG